MSMQKKSLIKSLKTTKKANVAASAPATKEGAATRKSFVTKSVGTRRAALDRMKT
jgi:hypothetical protein